MSSLSSFIQLRTFSVKCRPQVAIAGALEASSSEQSSSQRRAVKIPPVTSMATSSQRVLHGTECQNGATHAQPMASSAQAESASPQAVGHMDNLAAPEDCHIATAAVHAGSNSDTNRADSFVSILESILNCPSLTCAIGAIFPCGVAGERSGRPRVTDTLTTPIVQTSTYFFRDTADLIEFVVSWGMPIHAGS